MQLAQQKGPITCQIPGFSLLRAIRPTEDQRSVADIEPLAGMFFKSPTGSIHAVVSKNDTLESVNTIRVGTDRSVKYGRVLLNQSIRPDSGVSVYRLPDLKVSDVFKNALEDALAIKVLSTLFTHKEHLTTSEPTLGRERLYSAYLENLENSLDSLTLNSSRVDNSLPKIQLSTHYGGLAKSTIAFGWQMGDRASLRPEAIRTITADAHIRSLPDYLKILEAVVHAAGVFNAVVQAQHALPSVSNF
jgi:hypothetical protein